jgi:hypothetical protein
MDPNLMQMILIVVRHVAVTREAMAAAEEAGFLWKLLSGVIERPQTPLLETGLLVLDAFLNVGYVADYLWVIPHLGALIARGDKLARFTLRLLPMFARYRGCSSLLAAHGFPKYFADLKKRGQYLDVCNEFERNSNSATA